MSPIRTNIGTTARTKLPDWLYAMLATWATAAGETKIAVPIAPIRPMPTATGTPVAMKTTSTIRNTRKPMSGSIAVQAAASGTGAFVSNRCSPRQARIACRRAVSTNCKAPSGPTAYTHQTGIAIMVGVSAPVV